MRDWVIVIIVILIVGIVLDGLRRWRIARRESIRLSRNAAKADKDFGDPEEKPSSSEFPSGGARVVKQRAVEDASELNTALKGSYQSSRLTAGAPNRIPEQVTLNLDEAVPMLMESVELRNDETVEPETDADVDADADEKHLEPTIGNVEDIDALDDVIDEDIEQKTVGNTAQKQQQSNHNPSTKSVKKQKPSRSWKKNTDKNTPSADKHTVNNEKSPGDAPAQPDEVLIINIMSHAGQRFSGGDLLTALMEQNMKFGEMDIFHRHFNSDGSGPILFSLANMVVPGTFNLAAMKEFETPGVSLFLSLPLSAVLEEESESAALDAYNIMALTAQNLARFLDGELKDENRSVMTLQTIEHGRQRVIEYQRKRKLARV